MPSSSPLHTLAWSATFIRTARKFLERHPDLRGVFEDVLRQLERDPRAARLRLHALRGRYRGKHAVSPTYEYRIVLILRLAEKEVILLDVGTHDDVYLG
ncbi:MAG: plasmid stabilization protein [Chlamydiota bacterium]